MSTKNQTTGTSSTAFQFDPSSLAAYRQNTQSWLPTAQSWFTNPYGNDMFRKESAIGQDQAASVGARNKSNVLNNANALGYGTNSPLFNSMLNRAGMDTSALQANSFRSAVGNANQRATTGLGLASSFQPLMTGSNSKSDQTQTTSGLGTWLPQVLGGAAGMGMAALTGGASMAATGGIGAASKGIGNTASGASSMSSGLGNMFGNSGGYGYGSSSGNFVNPFMFGGRP